MITGTSQHHTTVCAAAGFPHSGGMEIFMTEEIKLCNIKAGECASVVRILPSCPIQRRLADIGLISGTHIKCLYASVGKNMKAYAIRGATIAIRDEDCAYVIVERSANEHE